MKGKQKLGVTFSSDKPGGIDFTKIKLPFNAEVAKKKLQKVHEKLNVWYV